MSPRAGRTLAVPLEGYALTRGACPERATATRGASRVRTERSFEVKGASLLLRATPSRVTASVLPTGMAAANELACAAEPPSEAPGRRGPWSVARYARVAYRSRFTRRA